MTPCTHCGWTFGSHALVQTPAGSRCSDAYGCAHRQADKALGMRAPEPTRAA